MSDYSELFPQIHYFQAQSTKISCNLEKQGNKKSGFDGHIYQTRVKTPSEPHIYRKIHSYLQFLHSALHPQARHFFTVSCRKIKKVRNYDAAYRKTQVAFIMLLIMLCYMISQKVPCIFTKYNPFEKS